MFRKRDLAASTGDDLYPLWTKGSVQRPNTILPRPSLIIEIFPGVRSLTLCSFLNHNSPPNNAT